MFWNLLPLSIRRKLEAPYRYDAYFAVRKILERAGGRKLRVLDAGAGDCFAKRWFRRHTYTALDIADSILETPDIPETPDIQKIKGSVEKLPFQNNTFDIVLCLEVLEYIEYPERALDEFFRVLANGGILVLSAPLMVQYHGDLRRFTPPLLKRMVTGAGFEITAFCSVGGYFRMLGWQISKLGYRVRKPPSKLLLPFYYLLKIPVGLVFQIILPLILFHLDFLDKEKKDTVGYLCIAVK